MNNDRYMTISTRGITHYHRGVGEFIKIESWEKEADQFHRLLHIEFFKKYKTWKNFFLWKKSTRKNQFIKNQKSLIKNLLLLDHHIQKPLMTIRRYSESL